MKKLIYVLLLILAGLLIYFIYQQNRESENYGSATEVDISQIQTLGSDSQVSLPPNGQ